MWASPPHVHENTLPSSHPAIEAGFVVSSAQGRETLHPPSLSNDFHKKKKKKPTLTFQGVGIFIMRCYMYLYVYML